MSHVFRNSAAASSDTRTGKIRALALLAAISLLGPVLEALVTGGAGSSGAFDLAEAFAALVPIYWWYHADKAQRQYRAGPLQNAGVIALAMVALPVYFVRSRGWRRGGVATALAGGVLAASFGLEWLGEALGAALAH